MLTLVSRTGNVWHVFLWISFRMFCFLHFSRQLFLFKKGHAILSSIQTRVDLALYVEMWYCARVAAFRVNTSWTALITAAANQVCFSTKVTSSAQQKFTSVSREKDFKIYICFCQSCTLYSTCIELRKIYCGNDRNELWECSEYYWWVKVIIQMFQNPTSIFNCFSRLFWFFACLPVAC